MIIRPDIAEFVANVEVFSKKKLNYPLEVGEILQIAIQTGLTDELEELIFQAKFLIGTQNVMKQIGVEAKEYKNLLMEFNSSIKKSMALLTMFVGRTTKDIMQKYSDIFFAMDTESLSSLMMLYADLSWIKNWQIDGRQLPYETKSQKVSPQRGSTKLQTKERQQNGPSIKSLSRIQRSADLAVILMLLFLLIDPPVTVLGWILSLGITALLAYIVTQIVFLMRNPDFH